jgi:hypothetical protein
MRIYVTNIVNRIITITQIHENIDFDVIGLLFHDFDIIGSVIP